MNVTCTTTSQVEHDVLAQSAPEEKSLYASLASLFTAFAQAEIRYALLRGYDELKTAHGHLEVDLLVAPHDLARLAEILARRNFAALPSWGHAPHHFFLGFDEQSGSWLKLDVVRELYYGAPARSLRVDLAEECLQQRQRCAPTYVLTPEHEFLTLFLHCLLDKKNFRAARRARLLELRTMLQHESSAGRHGQKLFEKFLTPALSWNALEQTLAKEDWLALLKSSHAITKRLQQGQHMSALRRKMSCFALRKLRPLLFALRRRGLFVALLAPDGAGKSTLAQALKCDFGLNAQLIYMGTNLAASTVGLPTTKWLHRTLKKSRAPKPLRLLLKPVNYCNRTLELWYRIAFARWQVSRGKFVVFDRYVYDSWIAKPATTWAKRLRRKFLEAGWPTPDLVILLDAPGELLFRRKGEHSPEWLEQQRQAYLALQKQLPQMRVLDATQNAEEARREAIALIWKKYLSCYSGKSDLR